jgi:hypothetical protein
MRANLGLIGKYSLKSSQELDYHILQNKDHELNEPELAKMREFLQEYISFKRGMRKNSADSFTNLDSFIAYLRKKCFSEISSNESELADYAIKVTYEENPAMVEFAWKMFPEGVLENVYWNSNEVAQFPIQSENGEIEYLWDRYTMTDFVVENLWE